MLTKIERDIIKGHGIKIFVNSIIGGFTIAISLMLIAAAIVFDNVSWTSGIVSAGLVLVGLITIGYANNSYTRLERILNRI